MGKKRKTDKDGASTSGANNDQMVEDCNQPPPHQPVPPQHRMVNLSRLANKPQEEWPENTRNNFGLKLTDDQKLRMRALMKRKISSSRYVCIPTLVKLGILDEVQALAERIGLWHFISTPYITYRTLTYEFLATYTHENYNNLSFQLDGTTFTISDMELNDICQFPNPGPDDDYLDYQEPWRMTTTATEIAFEAQINHPQRDGSYRSTVINHPVLRYLQRAMGFSIFGRGETASNYNRRDVYLLFKCLNIHKPDVIMPDLGAMMLRHIDHVTNVRLVGGHISIGGFVTRLAYHFGVLPTEGPIYRVAASEPPPLIDMRYVTQQAGLIREEDGVYYHLPFKGNPVPLPLPPIDYDNPDTWQALPPPAQPVPPPPAAVPADSSIMEYLVGMDSRFEQRFTALDTAWQNRYDDLQASHNALAQQVTALQLSQTDRFDDLYVMTDDTQSQLHDLYNIEYHMASFRIDNEGVPSFELPPRVRRSNLQYPFTFPPPPPPPQDDQ